jgi:hypothetical protein|tara:strand:+ start:214 stop:513 length:300 start_codon:yes stop_codon:yes gene_type:complete
MTEKTKTKNRKTVHNLISINYGYVKVVRILNDVNWRVRDELLHREIYDRIGGYFKSEDWVTSRDSQNLKDMDYHFTELKGLLTNRNHRIQRERKQEEMD